MSDGEWDPATDYETPADPEAAEGESARLRQAAAEPKYPTLDAWMDDWFVRIVRRRVGRGGVVWCAQWWAHAEAASRLAALWGAWEQAEIDLGSAPSQWWVWHFDAHWAVLTSPAGPFAACTADRHEPDAAPLPSVPRSIEDAEAGASESL